jgi:peptidoglycan/xylan/chitin deacetylase (PgdA/CDA1 family)
LAAMNKYYLQQAARVLSPILYYSGLHGLTRPLYSGVGHILMFHRVVPSSDKPRIHNHQSLEVSPQLLESTIQFFRKRNYDFISLNKLNDYSGEKAGRRKFVVFTFDDGYLDNYELAYPIFKKYNIPFTIYVTTGLPDGHAFLWWYLLEELILNNDTLELDVQGERQIFRTGSLKAKEVVFNQVRSILAVANQSALEFHKSNMFHNYQKESEGLTKTLSMNWNQIEELSKDSLVTIGSHTVNHYPLKSLSEEQSKFELTESRRIIESHIKMPVNHFCYPIGSYSKREVSLAPTCGYETATTINMSNVAANNLEHPFALPRIMINALTTEKILTLQVNGLLPFIRNKGRRVVL